MKFQLVFAAVLACAVAGPSGSRPSWNALLNADNLFSEEIDGRSYFEGDELAQLKELLSDATLLRSLYAKYVRVYDKMSERSTFTDSQERVFKEKLVQIAAHNLGYRAGKSTWEMGVNQFTDMTAAEIQARFTGFIALQSGLKNSSIPEIIEDPTLTPPLKNRNKAGDVDWREKKIVGPVKNQGNCGSCVPFGITSTLESAYAKKGRSVPDLSEQQIVDCCKGNGGCDGGSFPPTFDYLKESGGLVLEKDYKYEAKRAKCRMYKKKPVAGVESFGSIAAEDENDLADKLGVYGPLAIAVHVSDSFASYKSGVYSGPCDGGRNHAVALVGSGTSAEGAYWIVKNSWGSGWGSQGYIHIAKDKGNKCDVAGDAVYMVAK